MKNTKTTNNGNKGEKRFVCENWDATANIRFDQSHRSIRRKVVTTGNYHIVSDEVIAIIAEAKRKLREGKIVYLGADIILTPMMKTDFSGMYVSARTCGSLYQCLKDKKASVSYKGEVLSETEVEQACCEDNRRYMEHKQAQSVTPDTMVTCPECGFEFRVGNRLAARD